MCTINFNTVYRCEAAIVVTSPRDRFGWGLPDVADESCRLGPLTINDSNLHDTGHSIELTPAAAMAEQETFTAIRLNFRIRVGNSRLFEMTDIVIQLPVHGLPKSQLRLADRNPHTLFRPVPPTRWKWYR
jgi:hypothetical protein